LRERVASRGEQTMHAHAGRGGGVVAAHPTDITRRKQRCEPFRRPRSG
jgi:hypothetical protein